MIHLEKITWNNYSAAVMLNLHEKQRNFVGTNEFSLVQSYVSLLHDPYPFLPFAVYHDDTVVGFAMIAYYTEHNEYIDECCYAILRFMIGAEYQGKGFGKEALRRILEFIRTFPYGAAPAVILPINHENVVAKNLYLSFGFVQTGKDNDEGDALMMLNL